MAGSVDKRELLLVPPDAVGSHQSRERAATRLAAITLMALTWATTGAGHWIPTAALPSASSSVPLTGNQPSIPRADHHRCADIRTETWSPCGDNTGRLVAVYPQLANLNEPYSPVKAAYACDRVDARLFTVGATPHIK